MKRRKPRTVEEVLDAAQRDPAIREMWAEKNRIRFERHQAFRRAEAPLVRDLNARGIRIDTISDLVNTDDSYPAAIPVLVEHLQRPYPTNVKEGIARALAIPDASPPWDLLRELFEREDSRTALGLKWALACALGGSAPDDRINEVMALVQDKNHGENRAAFLPALRRSSRAEARQLLRELRSDPEIGQAARPAREPPPVLGMRRQGSSPRASNRHRLSSLIPISRAASGTVRCRLVVAGASGIVPLTIPDRWAAVVREWLRSRAVTLVILRRARSWEVGRCWSGGNRWRYSDRSTRDGAIRDTRQAGMIVATMATVTTSAVAAPRIAGSAARTS
jgi:hypothetical protein